MSRSEKSIYQAALGAVTCSPDIDSSRFDGVKHGVLLVLAMQIHRPGVRDFHLECSPLDKGVPPSGVGG